MFKTHMHVIAAAVVIALSVSYAASLSAQDARVQQATLSITGMT